jgi:hypothetical protein
VVVGLGGLLPWSPLLITALLVELVVAQARVTT